MIDHARIMDTSFSRNRLITLENLIYYLIFRNQQVLSQDIVSFFGNVNDFDIPTRQAIIKRMNILNFDVWNHILRQFRQNIYFHLNLYKLKDYIVIAVDGSFLDLPSHPALNHYFGGHQTRKISVDDISIILSIVFLVSPNTNSLTNFILCSILIIFLLFGMYTYLFSFFCIIFSLASI